MDARRDRIVGDRDADRARHTTAAKRPREGHGTGSGGDL